MLYKVCLPALKVGKKRCKNLSLSKNKYYHNIQKCRDAYNMDMLTFTILCFALSNTNACVLDFNNKEIMFREYADEDNVFIDSAYDSNHDYVCDDVKEHQQYQSAGNL